MSRREDIQRIIEHYYDSMNKNDVSTIPLDDDAWFLGSMLAEPIVGKENVRQYLEDTAPFSKRMELKSTVIEGDTAAAIVEFEGLNGVIIEGSAIFRFTDEKICYERFYFDTRPLIKGEN